jgi:hypothetical protein
VRQWFAEALARHGLKSNMDRAYAMERGEVPEKAA